MLPKKTPLQAAVQRSSRLPVVLLSSPLVDFVLPGVAVFLLLLISLALCRT